MEGSRCGFVYIKAIIYEFGVRITCSGNCHVVVETVIAFSCVLSKVQKCILSYLEEALS